LQLAKLATAGVALKVDQLLSFFNKLRREASAATG
jgi:hypothetical protein